MNFTSFFTLDFSSESVIWVSFVLMYQVNMHRLRYLTLGRKNIPYQCWYYHYSYTFFWYVVYIIETMLWYMYQLL
jgi:hypothetical protein